MRSDPQWYIVELSLIRDGKTLIRPYILSNEELMRLQDDLNKRADSAPSLLRLYIYADSGPDYSLTPGTIWLTLKDVSIAKTVPMPASYLPPESYDIAREASEFTRSYHGAL